MLVLPFIGVARIPQVWRLRFRKVQDCYLEVDLIVVIVVVFGIMSGWDVFSAYLKDGGNVRLMLVEQTSVVFLMLFFKRKFFSVNFSPKP